MSLNIATLLRESTLRFPHKAALIHDGEVLTYAELWAQVQRLAGSLRAIGLSPGQHVALMLPNTPAFPVAYYAAQLIGCPVVPLNTMLKADEITYHLNDSDSHVLIAGAAMRDEALAAWHRAPNCPLFIACGGDETAPELEAESDGKKAFAWTPLLQDGPLYSDLYPSTPEDTAVIIYTSGTTGRPKGAELSQFNLFYNAAYILQLPLSFPSHDIVGLLALPLFHSFGQTALQNAVLLAGGTLVLQTRFDAHATATLIEQHRVNYFAGVPTMYYALLHTQGVTPTMLSSLRFCLCGGAAMPEEVIKRFDATFGLDIIEAYGLSETSPVATMNPIDGGKRIGSIGRPIWGVEARLVDAAGAIITTANTPGEICIKGHNVMKGYYNRPEATREVLQDGWFHTGDIAERDDDGFYRIVDRKKDLIIRGGFNIYPREIEEILYAHTAVMEAAVVGLPHPSHGEEVHAFIVLRPGCQATSAELVHYCQSHLATYKYPRHIEILPQLPKGPTGKILKRALRDSHGAVL